MFTVLKKHIGIKVTMEKYENFINRKSGVLKVESEGIPNLCV